MLINSSKIDASINKDKNTPIIITSYHRPKTFIRCIDSVLESTDNQLIIIDNSNGKLNIELDRYEKIERVRIIKNDINIGKPQSINKYFDDINVGRWFITMDPDVIIPSGGIDKMISQADRLVDLGYPIAILCPAIVDDVNSWDNQIKNKSMSMHEWSEMYEIESNTFINSSLAGCIMLVNSEFFNKIGRFNTDKLYNDDDGYLCYLSQMNNMINIIYSDVKCQHDNSENEIGYLSWKLRNFYSKKDDIGYWD